MTLNRFGAQTSRSRFVLPSLLSLGLSIAVEAFPANPVSTLTDEVQQHEAAGDLAGARSLLQRQADSDTAAAQEYAEFLERHADPGCRDAYLKWASAEKEPARKRIALKQVVLFDFMHGDSGLSGDLNQYRDAGGADLALSAKQESRAATYSTISIPGPLSSFARMAALSPDLEPHDLLPALARNVVTNGYEASGNEMLQQTEYLRLVVRYISQARELQAMANKDRKIVIPTCDSEETGTLLKILGYRMRGSCGGDMILETVNATRAFLTVDSGFPLTQLEQDLRANHRFELPYSQTAIPVLYTGQYWLSALKQSGQSEFIDAFLSDPSLCRLYLGLSHLGRSTAEALRKQAPASKLKLYANNLDFYGNMFEIRNGSAVVPGSPKSWASLTGVSPNNPGAFFEKLISMDDGWLVSYFDALSRMNGPSLAYLTQPDRLRRFYDALRGKITTPGPARPVFRSSTELMLLTSSLRIDANGQPHIPGDLDVWRTLFIKHPHGKYDGKLTRSATSWRTNDDLLEALFGLSRKTVENEPLRIFLALNDIDRCRSKPISAQTAARLVSAFRTYGPQYVIFADAPNLSEASIVHYLEISAQLSNQRDVLVKADSIGTFQALIELWRILCRQDSIKPEDQDATFAKLIGPFAHLKGENEVFDGGRSGIKLLLAAAAPDGQGPQQEQLVSLLVGKLEREGGVPASPAENFLRVFDAQRLLPIDSIFSLADRSGKGTVDPKTTKIVNEQFTRFEETASLRSSLSSEEKNSFALGYWSERHVDQERKITLDALLKNSDKKDPRGVLAPVLRDSLIGLLYSYYAPAGAQLLITNPLFVRNHDFIGPEGSPAEWRQTELTGSGWPESAGGRLMGSLVSLPYAIAEAEQNFLMPRREQALIWADLVPQMIVNVTVNRWRNVTPEQLRWVSLHIQRGRDLLAATALDPSLAGPVLDSLRRFANPGTVEWVSEELQSGRFNSALGQIPPSALYILADDPALKNLSPDLASLEIEKLENEKHSEVAPEAIARAFGTPKPTLTHSYQPGLLHLRTFPALMGFSSRIMAESWESNNLYYAALADETGVPVNQLDAYVPEWNRAAIEGIFATHLEDWPAILRSLRSLSDGLKQHGIQTAAANSLLN